MRLTLNGSVVSLDMDGATLGALRGRLWRWAVEHGHTVCELKVNGTSRLWDQSCDAEELAPRARVEAVTQGVTSVAVEALKEAEHYLPGLMAGLARVSELVGSGQTREGMELFGACLEGLEWVCGLFRLMVPLAGKTRDGQDLAAEVEESVATLEGMAGTLRHGDLVGFTDLVNYRLLPALDAWGRELPSLVVTLQDCDGRAEGEGGGDSCTGRSGRAT